MRAKQRQLAPTAAHKHALIALCFSLLFGYGCDATSSSRQPSMEDIHLRQAEAYRRSGQLAAALLETDKAHALAPDHPNAHHIRAAINIQIGRPALAVAAIEKAELQTHNLALATVYLRAVLATGEYQPVVDHLAAHPELWAQQPATRNWLAARATESAGDYPRALEMLSTNLSQHDHWPSRLDQLKLTLLLADVDDAFTAIKQALQTDGERSELLYLLAQCHSLQGQDGLAAEVLTDSLQLLPNGDPMTLQRAHHLNALTVTQIRQNNSREMHVYDQLIADRFPSFMTQQKLIDEIEGLLEENKQAEAKIILLETTDGVGADMSVEQLLTKIHLQRGELVNARQLIANR